MRRRAVKHITQQADDAAGQLAMPRCRLLLGRRRVVRWRWRCLRVCAHTQALRRCYQAERCCRQCGAGIQEATSSLPQHKRLHLLPREAKLGHRQLWCLLLHQQLHGARRCQLACRACRLRVLLLCSSSSLGLAAACCCLLHLVLLLCCAGPPVVLRATCWLCVALRMGGRRFGSSSVRGPWPARTGAGGPSHGCCTRLRLGICSMGESSTCRHSRWRWRGGRCTCGLPPPPRLGGIRCGRWAGPLFVLLPLAPALCCLVLWLLGLLLLLPPPLDPGRALPGLLLHNHPLPPPRLCQLVHILLRLGPPWLRAGAARPAASHNHQGCSRISIVATLPRRGCPLRGARHLCSLARRLPLLPAAGRPPPRLGPGGTYAGAAWRAVGTWVLACPLAALLQRLGLLQVRRGRGPPARQRNWRCTPARTQLNHGGVPPQLCWPAPAPVSLAGRCGRPRPRWAAGPAPARSWAAPWGRHGGAAQVPPTAQALARSACLH